MSSSDEIVFSDTHCITRPIYATEVRSVPGQMGLGDSRAAQLTGPPRTDGPDHVRASRMRRLVP